MDIIIGGSGVSNDVGSLDLWLEMHSGKLVITAENHDGDVWETYEVDPVETIIKIFKGLNEAGKKEVMAIDFAKFEDAVDTKALQEEVNNAKADEFDDLSAGTYVVTIEKMEIKETNAGDKLMFAVQCKITEGEQKGRMIFFNRVITGNKTSDKWNDGKAIKSVVTWLDKLETETVPEFINYGDFAECVLDIFQEVQGAIELEVEYDGKKFNPISIKQVFDI